MTDDRRLARNPIAIVGMSGLLPNAHNHREYWQNIVDGVDCTTEVPASRWSLDDYFDADPDAPDKTYSRRGAFLPDIEFDPLEFGLPPNQLEVTSTMQTLSLGVARDLLTDAGAVDSAWYDPDRTGVVLGTTGPVPLMHPLAARLSTPVLKDAARSVGLSDDDADAVADKFVAAFAPWEANSFPGLLANITAGRVANRLGLGGINCTVDAACAASLAALRTAIAELQDGRADMMITGGVDTENTIFIYLCFSKVGALSASGQISPFSADANGTLLGEGITMLALRRLDDARRDGNRIYAVIRGLGSSSDGRAKSIYAPRAGGQRVALDRAYADAECSPADIALIEAHATGTPVGDKTELSALKGLLSEASSEARFAALGSVKSQIGHTKGAAGTASLMKLAFALHQKVLPGTINVATPNAEIAPVDAPYYVNTRTRPWIRDPQRPIRRAAASAFGFGGTNFHVVLEEADSVRDQPVLHRTARAHLWHAADVAGLIDVVRSVEPVDGGDIPDGHARLGFVSVDDENAEHLRALAVDELVRRPGAAAWDHPEGVYFRAAALPDRKIGALFAGQGSQYVDMGSDAALNHPAVGAAFDTANAAFAGAPVRLSSVVFPPPAFDEETAQEQEIALRRTEFAQPAIGALSAGQFGALTGYGLRADGYLGHSFGELTALWAAGALGTDDFFGLARARGAAMTPAEGVAAGTMAALGTSREMAEELLDGVDDVWICNHNAPDQVVIGGGTDGVAAVVARATERGLVTRALPVSGAFHTPYVAHAVDAFARATATVSIGVPDAPVYSNTPGAQYGGDVVANRQLLTEQLSKPVEFAAALTAMRESGCTVFVEFGPKQVLTALVRRTLGDDVIAIATDSGPIGNSDLALARAAVRLAVLGFGLHGINRHAAPAAVRHTPSRPMTVTISAPEYVPQTRRAAYAAALDDGYRVQAIAAQPDVPAAAPSSTPVDTVVDRQPENTVVAPTFPEATETTVYQAAQPYDPGADALDSALHQHLQTHRQYLDGQLDLARGLAGVLGTGSLDEATLRAVEAVKEHGVAISESHSRAGEVLAQLAELESGFAPVARTAAPAPRRVASTRQSAIESAPARRGIGAVESATAQAGSESQSNGHAAVPAAKAPVTEVLAATPVVETFASEPGTDGHVSNDALRKALQEVVAEKTGYPVEMVDPAMDLEADLGVDSIKRVQVIGALQERFPHLPNLGPEQLGTLRTLDQIADLLGAAEPIGEARRPSAVDAPLNGLPTAETKAVAAQNDTGDATGEVLRRALQEVVAEKTGYPVEMVDPAMDLEADLGVDSIKRVQVIGALQERFPDLPSLGPEQLGTLRTLDQIVHELAPSVGGDVHPKAEAAAETPRHTVELSVLPALDRAEGMYPADARVVLIDLAGGADADCAALDTALTALGWSVRRRDAAEAADLLRAEAVDVCVGVLSGGVTEWVAAQRVLTDAILLAGQAVPRLRQSVGRAAFVTVTRLDGGLGFHGTAQPVHALLGGVGGVVKTLAVEHPSLFCRALDVDPDVAPAALAELVTAELFDPARDTLEVGIDAAGERRTLVPSGYAPARSVSAVTRLGEQAPSALTADDLLLVTGGARGVTATCVLALAARSEARFLLLGRSEPIPEPGWAAGVADADLKAAAVRALAGSGAKPREIERACAGVRAAREIRTTLHELGSRAEYLAVDATDETALRTALEPWRDTITGVVHGAGVLADSMITDKTPETITRVLNPKLTGLASILAALGHTASTGKPASAAGLEGDAETACAVPAGDAATLVGGLRHLILFTSVAGLFGNTGQADYAAANEALSRFAVSWRAVHPDCHVTALDWGAWDGGMVTAELRQHFQQRGIALLAPEAGAAAFTQQFTGQRADDPIVLIGPANGLSGHTAVAAEVVRARRVVTGLTEDPIIRAHRIGEHIVLPATFGLGALAGLAERVLTGRTVVGARDFQVLKGLVFDHPVDELELEVRPGATADGRTLVEASIRGDGALHFRATLISAAATEPAPHKAIPRGSASDANIYRDGIQFHGPALQGLRMVRAASDDAIVFDCALPAARVANGAYASRLHDPVLADLILQGPPVLGYRLLGAACLPLGVGRVDYYRPLPIGEGFVLIVDNPRAGRFDARIDATAVTADGTVLQRFSDVTVVTTPDLTEKFQNSVRRWMA
ncbi:type I polyketide synthase [Nocardia brasiliensis]|uniref:type I polyketide synthase n=1 Tax=Nocardia brasiliensis TaxID=37326 RepID=UPI002454A28F|nr:type I polyketide synthase [Nocardia brasiliensis]